MQIVTEMSVGIRFHVRCIIVCSAIVQMVAQNPGTGIFAAERKAEFCNQNLLGLGCKLAEGLLDVGEVTVYVEMVGIHGGDN